MEKKYYFCFNQTKNKMNSKAKPFIKWVGGKGQLIEQLEMKLPADFDNWDDATYRFVITKD